MHWGRWKGAFGLKRPRGVISVPSAAFVSSETGGCQKSDNNFGSSAVFGLAVVLVFTERTSLLIKLLSFVPSCFAVFFFFFFARLPDCGKKDVSSLVFIEAIIGISTYERTRYCQFHCRNTDALCLMDLSASFHPSCSNKPQGVKKRLQAAPSTAGVIFNP